MSDHLRCPACTAPDVDVDAEGRFFCSYCGNRYLFRCPSCQRENAATAEKCAHCGEPLTVVAAVLGRHEFPGPPLWLRQTRSRAQALKDDEAGASGVRMGSLLEIDRRRLRQVAMAEAERRAKDRRAFQVVIISAGMFLLVVLTIALLSYLAR